MSNISSETNAEFLVKQEDGTYKKINFETNIEQVVFPDGSSFEEMLLTYMFMGLF